MSSFNSGDVVMNDVEYLIEEEGVDVNSDASVILLVEEDPEYVKSDNVDTFSCGKCHETWTDLSEFLDHKKSSCQQIILLNSGNDTLEQPTVLEEDVVHFDENASTDILTLGSIHSEDYSNASDQFLEVDGEVGEGDVILQLEDREEGGEDDQGQNEIDAALKNSPPKFPLILDEDDFEDDDSFPSTNPYSCTYCGNLLLYH
jgi:hypothetical protein